MKRKPFQGYDLADYPLDKYPYYEIHDWDDHQPPQASLGPCRFIRNHTALLDTPKYIDRSPTARTILHGLWLIRGQSGLNPRRDPDYIRTRLRLARNKHTTSALRELEKAGFIKPSSKLTPFQRRGEEMREEEIRKQAEATLSNLPPEGEKRSGPLTLEEHQKRRKRAALRRYLADHQAPELGRGSEGDADGYAAALEELAGVVVEETGPKVAAEVPDGRTRHLGNTAQQDAAEARRQLELLRGEVESG